MKQRQGLTRTLVALGLLMSGAGVWAQGLYDIAAVARAGDAAPVPRALVRSFLPSLNNKGQVAFAADGGAFLQSEGETTLMAGYGTPAPGGGLFISTSAPQVNAQGQAVFYGRVTPPGRSGLFLFTEGKIERVVGVGDPAPGGGTFNAIIAGGPGDFCINAQGQVAFLGYASSQAGVFLFSEGNITKIVRPNDPLPGGGFFAEAYWVWINDNGAVVFSGAVLDPFYNSVFLFSQGNIRQLVREGDPAPGGGTFRDVDLPIINNAGRIAFWGFTTPSFTDAEVFLIDNGRIIPILRIGDAVPGGGTVRRVVSAPVLNEGGQIGLAAELSTEGFGTFLFSDDALILIARPGDLSPDGDLFDTVLSPWPNDNGQVVFTGRTTGLAGAVFSYEEGKITRLGGGGDPVALDPKFYDAAGPAVSRGGNIAFNGTTFPGASGVYDGTPDALARTGDAAPGGGLFIFNPFVAPAVNDRGQVAFEANLSSGTLGLFLTSVGKVSRIARAGDPAPGGGTFLNARFPSINTAGEVAFLGLLSSGTGVFLFSGNRIIPVMRPGDPRPDGGTFTSANLVRINDQDQVVFSIGVSTVSQGLFLFSGGTIRKIYASGDPAPGGGSFTGASPVAFSINTAGQVVFLASVSSGYRGVFLFENGNITKLVQTGDPAPGGVFQGLGAPSLNDSGEVAFEGSVSAGGSGLFFLSGISITAIVRVGDAAPGGGTFIGVQSPQLDGQGQVVFLGNLSDGTNGVFLAMPQ